MTSNLYPPTREAREPAFRSPSLWIVFPCGTVPNVFSEQAQSLQGRARQREETRHHVLAVAARMFRAHGFNDTSVRQIAKEAGVSVGTVMLTGDKKTLLLEVFGRWIREIHTTGEGRYDEVGPNSPVDAITAVVEPFFRLFTSNRELAQQYGAALISPGDHAEHLNELAGYMENEVRSALVEHTGQKDGVEALSSLIYHVYLGHLFAWAAGKYSDDGLRRQARQSVESIIGKA